MALLLDVMVNWMVALYRHNLGYVDGAAAQVSFKLLLRAYHVSSSLFSASVPIVLVAWPVSQACLPTAAVLVLELVMNFYAGQCLLLLLALVNYSVKNFLTKHFRLS
jgi:hypothetical protein